MNYTSLESYVHKLLHSIQITTPDEININKIAHNLEIELNYWNNPSEALIVGNEKYIFLDKRASRKEQVFKFGHELSHVLMDCGQQYGMPELFREYQEWKADNFAYHLCVPTFMLENMDIPFNIYKATDLVCKNFNVTIEVAVKRLKQFETKKQEDYFQSIAKKNCTEKDRILNLWY
ncbi:ImmA/IrrE family metallo-endopeptidase [Halobacillus sp. Cin3]|uniref:ImmA/IrrE family metallo-endopeptidase n=1 Tax=Halobacillus sp. Cin3 TaxID=2928441 RepID=UPI00248E0111|nr:ImmA/IrrE family metallo-endopeptidase [Halobacillus sp. Cin3]